LAAIAAPVKRAYACQYPCSNILPARETAFLARMIRPGCALPPDDAGDAFNRPARHKLKALRIFHREAED
jgi:hypothetical protein